MPELGVDSAPLPLRGSPFGQRWQDEPSACLAQRNIQLNRTTVGYLVWRQGTLQWRQPLIALRGACAAEAGASAPDWPAL